MRASTVSLAVALALAAALAGCKSMTQTARPASGTASDQSMTMSGTSTTIGRELAGDWMIIDVKGHQVIAPQGAEAPYMGFSTNQENPGWIDFYAFNGCNFINGVVALKGSKIARQGDFAATMKMCDGAEHEMAISTALEQMKSLRIDKINNESFLYLLDSSGHVLMTLRKHNLNFLEGAWAVNTIEGEKVPARVNIRINIDLQTNSIHSNAGCNTMNGKVNINMAVENGIGFSDFVTTRMTCPDIAWESAFLQELGHVATATGNNRTAQLRDASGKTIIELSRLDKKDLED